MIPETTACIHSYGKKIAGKDCQAKNLIGRVNAVNQVLCDVESGLNNQAAKLSAYCAFEYIDPPAIQPAPTPEAGCFPTCVKTPEFLYLVTVNDLDADIYELVGLAEAEACGLLKKLNSFAAINEDFIDPLEPLEPDINLFRGLSVTLKYDKDVQKCGGSHMCDAAIYKIYGNGIFIGTANLNNDSDGGSRSSTFVISEEMAQDIAADSIDGKTISFEFECDPTAPGFVSYDFNGGCHPDIGNLVILAENGDEIYDGCPTGAIDIDVTISQ